MEISHDALVTLATEEAVFPNAEDALDRLTFLVGPMFLTIKPEKRVTAPIASELVEVNFGLKLPLEVSEAMLFRLSKHGFINSEEVGEKKVFSGKGGTKKNGSAIDELIKDFRLFVKDKSLLPQITDDEILHLFMSEVFKISDLLNEEDFQEKGKKFEKWKTGVISDYIVHHTDEDGRLPPLLSKLSELCLLRSVVGSMTQQRRLPNRSGLVAILDAPLALFAIGASGKLNKSGISSTVELARKIGVRFAVFPASIKEMQRVLHATLTNDHRDRRGLTAAAIRRGELLETVAADIQRHPEKYAKEQGITTLPRTLETFPQDEHFFSEENYREFSVSASSWSNTEAGEYHDAECLTLTMRARKGKHSSNLLSNDYVFVTNNWKFASAARRRCLELFMINEGQYGPVVHLNSFAASIWLAGGFEQEARIPEKTLLAACERVLSNHSGVVDKARDLITQFKLTDDATLELLIQDRDSVNAMMSMSSYDPALINEENIGVLLSAAKTAIAKEVSEEASKEREALINEHELVVQKVKEDADKQFDRIEEEFSTFKLEINDQLEERDKQIEEMERSRQQEIEKQRAHVQARVERLNRQIVKNGWGLVEWFEIVFFAFASALMGFGVSFYFGFALLVFGIFFVTFSYFSFWFPSKLKFWVIRKAANLQLTKEFSGFEIETWKISINEDIEAVMSDV